MKRYIIQWRGKSSTSDYQIISCFLFRFLQTGYLVYFDKTPIKSIYNPYSKPIIYIYVVYNYISLSCSKRPNECFVMFSLTQIDAKIPFENDFYVQLQL